MNKQGFASKVAEKKEISKKEALELVEVVFESALEGLVEDGKVDLFALGKLEKVEKSERTGVNPKLLKELIDQGVPSDEARERAAVQIKAKNAPKYKPSKTIKEALNK